ncbi:MAG: hypothetical protein JHD28_10765, partial [Bacteroidia bacterium]|nr:hypothetical protein [Bacteroidia bacterium]
MKNCTKFWVVITILFFISCEKPFKAHFEEITGEKFLEQMEIMCQESTDSDVFGDYGAILIVKVGEVFY